MLGLRQQNYLSHAKKFHKLILRHQGHLVPDNLFPAYNLDRVCCNLPETCESAALSLCSRSHHWNLPSILQAPRMHLVTLKPLERLGEVELS